MKLSGLLDIVPLWWLFMATVTVSFLSYEIGFRAGRWRSRRSVHEKEVVVRAMVAATIGLLTFILAFTFWIAATHFDEVRQAKLNEANAIRTAYLRSDFFPEPYRTEIRDLLREYVDVRLVAHQSEDFDNAISRSEEIHRRIWSLAVSNRDKISSPIFAGYFIQSINDVIALQTRRLTVGLEYRIPNTIWYVLYIITALALISLGLHAGLTEATRPLVMFIFVLIISIVMSLIADLDSPRKGSLRVSQQVYVDLQRTLSQP